MAKAVTYEDVNALWKEVPPPAITRHEATRAAKALYRRFGSNRGFPRMRTRAKLDRVRACWITTKQHAGINRGWERMVHDISHRLFDLRYGGELRAHHPLHATLEFEIALYVIRETDWLKGTLAAKPKPKASPLDAYRAKMAKLDEAEKRWSTKAKRATNALKKIRHTRARLVRRYGSVSS